MCDEIKLFIVTCFSSLAICNLRKLASVFETISNTAVVFNPFSLGFLNNIIVFTCVTGVSQILALIGKLKNCGEAINQIATTQKLLHVYSSRENHDIC